MKSEDNNEKNQKLIKFSQNFLLEKSDEHIQTIYSSSSEELLNNIQNKDILEKVRENRRIYVHDLCELARSRGRFEKLTLGLILAMAFCLGFYSNLNFLISRPVQYECHEKLPSGYKYVPCTEDQACNLYKDRYRVVKPEFWSIEQQFKLYCERKEMLGVLINIVMLFSPLSCFIIGYLADFIGRRKALVLTFFVGIVGFLLSFFGQEFTLYIIGNCCLNSFQNCSLMLLFLYSNEILGRDFRNRAVGLILLVFTIGRLIFFGIYDMMTSFRQIFLVQVALIVVFIPIIRFLRESPFHLAHSKRFRELSKMLKKILETNFKNNVVD